MQMTAVYACVRVLAESVASLPLHLYRRGTAGNREKAEEHPLFFLLHDEPNPERLRNSWNAAYGGAGNAGKVAILEEGMTFTPVSISPQDAQLLEKRKFTVEEICRIFRVPPHLVQNLDRTTFNNIEQMSIDFVMYSLMP